MPIYEYEPLEPCALCEGRFEVLQSISEDALTQCPHCPRACRRVVSSAAFRTSGDLNYDRAAKKGFTTYKKAGEGTWEKVAGSGLDVIQGSAQDIAAAKAEKAQKPAKKLIIKD